MPRHFDKMGYAPPERFDPEKESRRLTSDEYIAEREQALERRIANSKDVAGMRISRREREQSSFNRQGMELQRTWLPQLRELRARPSAENADRVLAEIDERLALLQSRDPSDNRFSEHFYEKRELRTLRAAFEALKGDAPSSTSPEVGSGESAVEQATQPEIEVPLPKAVDWVLLPPDRMEEPIGPGEGSPEWYRQGEPRAQMLRDLLGSLQQDYREIVGEVDPASMRDTPYHGFELPGLGRVVFVNDGYGEATYIVGQRKSLEELSRLSKRDLRMSTDARRISYPGDKEKWKEIVSRYLTESLKEGERVGRDHLSIGKIGNILKQDYGIGMRDDVLTGHLETIARLSGLADTKFRRESANVSRTGNTLYEYDPEFVERAIDTLVPLAKPNEGWKTLKGIFTEANNAINGSHATGVDYSTVAQMVEEMLAGEDEKSRGEIERRFFAKGVLSDAERENNPFGLKRHYGPEFVKKVVDRILRETPPPDASTVTGIRERLRAEGIDTHDDNVRAKAEEFVARNPQEYSIGNYRDSGPRRKNGEPLKLFFNAALTEALVTYFRAKKLS